MLLPMPTKDYFQFRSVSILWKANAMPSYGGIMHFQQYFHQAFFLLKTDHKPFEWLVIVFYAYRCRGKWISMQQDFHFKIVHCASSKHANVDALSRNLVDKYEADEDFGNEIQDLVGITQDALNQVFTRTMKLLSIYSLC